MVQINDVELNKKYPPHLERKKQNMMKRRRKTRIRRRVVVFLFLLVCAGVILMVFKAPFLNIGEIICDGHGDMTVEDVVKISGIAKGENIFSVSVSDAEQNLKSHPEIKDATVQRAFPDKIKIYIERSVPVAFVEYGKNHLIIDEKGGIIRVVANDDADAVNGLVKVYGVPCVSSEPGTAFAAQDDVRAGALYSCLGVLVGEDMVGKVDFADFSDLSDIKMEYESRIQIAVGGHENMAYKIKFVKKVIDERLSAHERVKINCRGEEFIVGPRDDDDNSKDEATEEVDEVDESKSEEDRER